MVGFATNKHRGIWVPRDLIWATQFITEAPLAANALSELAGMWQHKTRYLPSYTYDWWNHLDEPAPRQISSIREALAACTWDRGQSVPYLQEGCAMRTTAQEALMTTADTVLSPDEFTARCLREAEKQCQAARSRVQTMIEKVMEEMKPIRETLATAGIKVDEPKVVATKARLVMMRASDLVE